MNLHLLKLIGGDVSDPLAAGQTIAVSIEILDKPGGGNVSEQKENELNVGGNANFSAVDNQIDETVATVVGGCPSWVISSSWRVLPCSNRLMSRYCHI